MAKNASQRRFDKRAKELGNLHVGNPEEFARVWERCVHGWLGEVRTRARAERTGDAIERRVRIFEVLTRARCLAQASKAQTSPVVVNSLTVIEHECAKAVAGLTDPCLYAFNEDCTTRIRNLSVKNRTRS